MAVTVRFWAGARRAAGSAERSLEGTVLGDVLDQLTEPPELAKVIAAASFLVDGVSAERSSPLAPGAIIDVLPPFAGG